MLLVLDLGNTNVKAIVYKDKQEVYFKAVFTKRDRAKTYYKKFLKEIHNLYPEVEGFVLSSVVPSITETIYQIAKDIYKMDGLIVKTSVIKDLKIKYPKPDEIGADLLATTVGAITKYQAPLIICDLGTATKIMVVDQDSAFCGGLIIPGVTVSNKAMQEVIPHLPKVELKLTDKLVNDDTMSCIQAGLTYGTIYQVRGLCEALEKEFNFKATRILTGGYGKFLKEKMEDFIYDEYLGSEGLVEIFYRYHS